MITSASSPVLQTSSCSSPSHPYSPRSRYDSSYRSKLVQPTVSRTGGAIQHSRAPPDNSPYPSRPLSVTNTEQAASKTKTVSPPRDNPEQRKKQMVDASTQYSPPSQSAATPSVPASGVANLRLEANPRPAPRASTVSFPESPRVQPIAPRTLDQPRSAPRASNATPASTLASSAKRSTSDVSALSTSPSLRNTSITSTVAPDDQQTAKRLRTPKPTVKLMPMQYEHCDPKDMAVLISSMLMELVRYNDSIPLRGGHLTRFHSRAPPTISVLDYLQRLTTHATLSPPILLSMVFYIDRLCALYPAFTISSLTVHRFLITAATVASKGLSDSFWTNKTYARVGGVTLKELALLELEFLWRVEWRIVPKPEVLVDYYRSLVERSDQYEIDITGKLETEQDVAEIGDTGTTQSHDDQHNDT